MEFLAEIKALQFHERNNRLLEAVDKIALEDLRGTTTHRDVLGSLTEDNKVLCMCLFLTKIKFLY